MRDAPLWCARGDARRLRDEPGIGVARSCNAEAALHSVSVEFPRGELMIGFGVAFTISAAIALSTAILGALAGSKHMERKMDLFQTAAIAATCAAALLFVQIVAML